MDDLSQLWREHENAPYPHGYRGVEIAGVELVLLDADIAGCVSTYLSRGGQLDLQRTAILGRSYRAMRRRSSPGSRAALMEGRVDDAVVGAFNPAA